MKAEFHVHTRYSNDSMLNYFFILIMCKFKKIDCIAITDHNEIRGAQKYKKKLENHNIKVIVGEEIFTNQGEIIGLFLEDKIEPNLTPKETIEQIKKQNGIVYIPHPYDEKRVKSVLKEEYINEFSSQIDIIEIHNGRNINELYDVKQKEISEKYNIHAVIGSDAHTFFELGRNTFDIKHIDRENFVNNIDVNSFEIKKCIKFSHIVTKYVKAFKMICRGDMSGLYRAINKRCRKKE